MLKLTEPAAAALLESRRQRQLPEHYGIRVTGGPDDGRLDVKVGFAPEPADSDVVAEQHGVRLFVAETVAETLADAEMDVTVAVSGDGSTPTKLVVRPQQA